MDLTDITSQPEQPHERLARLPEPALPPREISPVYVDGPLKGREFKVDSLRVAIPVLDGTPVIYEIRRLKLFGRHILVAATVPADQISEDDLFDLIISDHAKQASEPR